MRNVDVIVIGAGLAGLSAALELHQKGRSVRVLEARDRVGGRTMGRKLRNGATVEMGGQWVGETQTEVFRLIGELALETFPTYDDGAGLTAFNGSVVRYEDESFGLPEETLVEIEGVRRSIEKLASDVDVSAPWEGRSSNELDMMTAETWLSGQTDDELAVAFYRTVLRALFAAEAHELSLLHLAFYVKSGGSLDILIATTGGAQQMRVKGGSQLISERIAEGLGEAVSLNTPVDAISQSEGLVTVRTRNGDELSAREAIVALPPTLAGRLRYEPPLPAVRDLLTQQLPMGSVIKVQAAFRGPFWRNDGLSGQVVSLDDPLTLVYDNSPPDASSGVLVGFFEAAHAREAASLTAERRRDLALANLTKFFGADAGAPDEFVETIWADERYTRGCYGGRLGTGVWTQYGRALREPIGRIHWAGAETAETWNGYMDGAVRSGRRAAVEALAALR